VAVYRYRLADNDKNINTNSRVIEGFRLRKNAWLVSDDHLDFTSFSDFVEEQSAESIADLDKLDLNISEPIVTTEKVISDSDMTRADDLIENASSIIDKSPKIAISIRDKLIRRGFSDAELEGRSEKDLEDLLAFDSSISTERG
jgi:hypothetical protein